ncbi:MAG: hypothetical protein AMS18_00030 [Gemmatimonas sp. SG8_17]|nr:MAG: hypothetical protein AMS18_00030 [Gemmatimonas sp. SG8_17]
MKKLTIDGNDLWRLNTAHNILTGQLQGIEPIRLGGKVALWAVRNKSIVKLYFSDLEAARNALIEQHFLPDENGKKQYDDDGRLIVRDQEVFDREIEEMFAQTYTFELHPATEEMIDSIEPHALLAIALDILIDIGTL